MQVVQCPTQNKIWWSRIVRPLVNFPTCYDTVCDSVELLTGYVDEISLAQVPLLRRSPKHETCFGCLKDFYANLMNPGGQAVEGPDANRRRLLQQGL